MAHPAESLLRPITADLLWDWYVFPELFGTGPLPPATPLPARHLFCNWGTLECNKPLKYVGTTDNDEGTLPLYSDWKCVKCIGKDTYETRQAMWNPNHVRDREPDAIIRLYHASYFSALNGQVTTEIRYIEPPISEPVYRLVEKDHGKVRYTTTEELAGDDLYRFYVRGLVPDKLLRK